MKIIYPTPEKVVEYNLLVLNLIKVKKGDKPELLSKQKLVDTLNSCKNLKGDIHDKAGHLLAGLIQKHPFASGNRRTAFIVTKDFLLQNKAKFRITDNPEHSKIMVGIREGFYTSEEIKEWIKNGNTKKSKIFCVPEIEGFCEIKEFKR
jgi:death-on-curing family protein